MRIGVLTSGGDCPGLNAVIRAVSRRAERTYGDQLFGFVDGWRGVMDGEWRELGVAACRGLLPLGGTMLGTSRVTPYQSDDGLDRVRAVTSKLALDGFVVIGGDGSLSCAHRLHGDGIRCVGVPKTIDNDVGLTEFTVGFDTAVHIASTAIDRLHTTAEAHHRVLVVEVMGRHTGHIAIRAGMAGGAALTLIPEHPFDVDDVCAAVQRRHSAGRFATVIVVAEGALPLAGGWKPPEPARDQYGHLRLGGLDGVGIALGHEIEARTGIETRVTILGHVQRGGSPTAFDRVLASRFGVAAVDAAHADGWGTMVALQADHIVQVPIGDSITASKSVSEDLWEAASAFFA